MTIKNLQEYSNDLLKKNGGPAFPVSFQDHDGATVTVVGINIRDYFAAMALQGFFAYGSDSEAAVAKAYKVADLMLVERDKK